MEYSDLLLLSKRRNNFSLDASCKALWRLESGALTADSVGNNTLTNSLVAEDTSVYTEGSCAALFNGTTNQHLEIADASLVSGFPLKSGDATKVGTWCFFFRPTNLGTPQYQDLVAKFDYQNSKRSLAVYAVNTSLKIQIGTGSSYTEYTIGTIANNNWYHIGITFDGVAKSWYVKLYNIDTDTAVYNNTFASTYEVGAHDCPFDIGRVYPNTTNQFSGQIDEVVVFNRRLYEYEIDAIRDGIFGPPGNDFSNDPSCKALWSLDSGALTVDSKGKNTLTTYNTPTESITDFREGGCSVNLVNTSNQSLQITDANLDAGFPFKNGDATRLITMCCWFKAATFSGYRPIIGKIRYTDGPCIGLETGTSTSTKLYVRYDASDQNTGIVLSTNVWYHVALVCDGPNGDIWVRLYDHSTGTASSWSSTTLTPLAAGAHPWCIGGFSDMPTSNCWDGKIDEVIVFNRLLSDGEIDSIRKGLVPTYSGSTAATLPAVTASATGTHTGGVPPITFNNNFTDDSFCKALWRLEPGALTTDSKSTNTLTASASPPTSDGTYFQEGSGSAAFVAANTQCLYITDANLAAGFPLKSGDTNKKISVASWVWWDSTPDSYVWSKMDVGGNQRTLGLDITTNKLCLIWATTLSATTTLNTNWQPTTGRWYHVTAVVDGLAQTAKIRVYDPSTLTATNYTFSSVGALAVGTAPWVIGARWNSGSPLFPHNGKVDEVVVFNRLLSDGEADNIRRGIFPVKNRVTDFSEYTTDQAPNDWTERWNAADGSLNISNTGVIGGKCLQVAANNSRYAASWDTVGIPENVEVLAKVKSDAAGLDDAWRIILRGNYVNNIVGYMAYGRNSLDQVRVGYYNDSTTFVELGTISVTIDPGVYYWVRFRAVGGYVKCKVWAAGTSEPSSWGLDVACGMVNNPGWVMAGEYTSSNNATFDWFGVAVNGATASVPETGNFYNDPTCKARWRFETNAFVNDSQGRNTLTPVNTPTADGTNLKEGISSAACARSSQQYFTIPDADLSDNFPFKSNGSYQIGTYCCWVKFTGTLTANNYGLMGKLRTPGGCGMFMYNSLFYLEFNNAWQSTGFAATTGEWYHVTCRMDGPNGYSDLTVYQASTGQLSFYSKGNWGALGTSSADFRIGNFNDPTLAPLDGYIDEALVFNRYLTNDEIMAVREGRFGGIVVPPDDSWYNGAPWPILGWNDGSETYWHNGLPLKPLVDPEAATSDLAAMLAPVTASITGNLDPTGHLAATLQKITASGSGTSYGTTKIGKVGYTVVYNVLNEIRAGKVGYTVVYSTESDAEPVTGDLAATIQALTADIDAYSVHNYGDLNATLQSIVADIDGIHYFGTLSATLPKIQAHIDAIYTIPDFGVLNARLAQITASGSGVHFSLPDMFDLTLEVSRRVRYYKKT